MQDPYCYPGTNVLKNKLDIHDTNELYEEERNLSNLRAEELIMNGLPDKPTFDFAYIKKIHKYLFQDVYDWAGKVRTVDIAKGNLFCRCFAIDAEANRIFTELKHDKYLSDLNIGTFAKKLAYYFAEINALHPFREGNGRTQREFIRQLAFQNNYFLSYRGITKDEMITASVASFKLNYAPLEELILNHLRAI